MAASHFRELEVWRLAMDLAKAVYQLSAGFPRDERFGLTAQIRRAAVSVPSNIAEGNARHTTRDYARFITIAAGSTAELQTQLLLAQELGFGQPDLARGALDRCERVSQMLSKLHRALEHKLTSGYGSPGPGSRVPGPEQ